jgi:hypothetical protein
VGLRLKLVVLGKVTEVGCFRAAVVTRPSPVKDDDGSDVFGSGDREIQREIGTQREANHRKAAVGLAGTFVEERCCICEVGLGSVGISKQSFANGFGVGNVVCDLAVIKVWGEGDETRWRRVSAVSLIAAQQLYAPRNISGYHLTTRSSGGAPSAVRWNQLLADRLFAALFLSRHPFAFGNLV